MKAFLFALVAIGVIAVGTRLYLDTLDFSSAATYTTSNVRLGDCVGVGAADTETAVPCLPTDVSAE